MIEMVLDRESDAPVVQGFTLITTEVAFLDAAGDCQQSLHVRGPVLCDWAEALCQARAISYRYVESPTRELVAACPGLNKEGALTIYSRLQNIFARLPRPLTATDLLAALYPARLWGEQPSSQHAAEWLLWLLDHPVDSAVEPLVDACCDAWQTQVRVSERVVYQARDRDSALRVLDGWLGVADAPQLSSLGEFPLQVPSSMIQRLTETWRRRAIASAGAFFADVAKQPLPAALKQAAAKETAAYYRKHPQDLTESAIAELSPYLTSQEQNDLRKWVRPAPPSPMPTLPAEVLRWFQMEYLPFRRWQAVHAAGVVSDEIQAAANTFAAWYLQHYSAALSGGKLREHLSFVRSAALASSEPNAVTLLVVLDGLHVADARHLQLALQSRTSRLTQVLDGLAFTVVPTITRFCKPALFHGVQPDQVEQVSDIGIILPEKTSPVEQLKYAHPGDLFLWRVLEPDHTYHQRNNYDTLRRQVEGQLDTIAINIADIVEQVSDSIRLRIVVTTDHGRLLADSERTRSAPNGMEVHGRTAWGACDKDLSDGYCIEDNIAYLHHSSFGLPADTAVLLDESAFTTKDGKGGSEQFPHGGLFPEEIIIPWLVYERDFVAPVLDIVISGQGQAGKPGTLEISVINSGDIGITLLSVELTATDYRRALRLDSQVAAGSAHKQSASVPNWPSQQQVKSMNATVYTRLSNGLAFTFVAKLELQSEEMYQREDILEGLDL